MHLHLPKLPKPARLLPITLALVAVLAVASGVAFAAHLAAQAASARPRRNLARLPST
jgi:hypothetical protein